MVADEDALMEIIEESLGHRGNCIGVSGSTQIAQKNGPGRQSGAVRLRCFVAD
jgi:hypothetical protein